MNSPFADHRHVELLAPDLDLSSEIPVLVSQWLKPLGAWVLEGESLLELVAGDVSVDLPAPVSGRLVDRSVSEDDRLSSGQRLGTIQTDEVQNPRQSSR